MADTRRDRPPEPTFEHAFDVEAEIDPAIEIGDTGDGHRRIIPIAGGTVSGRVEGEVLAAGADYQLFRADRPSTLVAKYAIETTDGDRIYVENEGIRFAPPEVSERIRDGRDVDPDQVYFRSVPSFETAPDLQWLTRSVFVATGVRMPDGVHLAVYRVA
ncbi:DUF3237 domain-containing protein [Halarchaeum nitratireducens]|uniref:UPF0311 protein YveG n=1 Tax=Halarchaeum nitratireducens TaxID=489913 RepID=A0A830G7V1_9EURY|nr:DUF3237 domain-containing protein [Halarchaeum nitratireducens]GGN07787.1 UPF0311 protein YveG [Halarchaeum nitratireducens]